MIDEPQLLDAMLEDLGKQRDIHQPGPYWQDYAQRIARAIRSEGLAKFRASPKIGRGFVDVFPGDALSRMQDGPRKAALEIVLSLPVLAGLYQRREEDARSRARNAHASKQELYRLELDDWFRAFSARHELPDTTVGEPERRLTLADREIGELYLRTFAWVEECSKHVDLSKVTTMFEIGGGFGAMAHTLMHLFPNIRKYLYVDIPPVLYVGTEYLKHFYGESVIDYTQTRSLETIGFADDDSREILAVCPWQLERVEATCDFFWNSSSFQEMPADIVRNYASNIERLLGSAAHLGYYVYEGGAVTRTLGSNTINEAFESETSFNMARVETTVATKVLPGTLYLGMR